MRTLHCIIVICTHFLSFADGASGKEPASQRRRCKREMRVRSRGQEGPLEEGMANHCSILAWRIPWTEELGRLQSMRSQRVRHNWSDLARTHTHISYLISLGFPEDQRHDLFYFISCIVQYVQVVGNQLISTENVNKQPVTIWQVLAIIK